MKTVRRGISPVLRTGIQGANMRLNASVSIIALAIALAGLRYREPIRQYVFPNLEENLVVGDLSEPRRREVMDSHMALCLRKRAEENDRPVQLRTAVEICGCETGSLAKFLNPRELATGKFESVRRYIDHEWNVRDSVTKCAREASVSL